MCQSIYKTLRTNCWNKPLIINHWDTTGVPFPCFHKVMDVRRLEAKEALAGSELDCLESQSLGVDFNELWGGIFSNKVCVHLYIKYW